MSIEKVEGAVLSEAEAAARAIVEEARAAQAGELAKFAAEGERAYAAAMEEAKARAQRETIMETGNARHRGRLSVLAAKNKILDGIFHEAAETLSRLEYFEYMRVMALWLTALPAEAGGALHVAPEEVKKFDREFFKGVNSARGEKGQFTGVTGDGEVKGGFILEGADYRFDQTIEHKIQELRESMAGELAGELFKE